MEQSKYMCGNCRKFEDEVFAVVYAHTTKCTDFYFNEEN